MTIPIPNAPVHRRQGFTGLAAELSDDGRHALVEFVAKDRKLLDVIANSGQRLERKDASTKDSIYDDFKRYRRNFNPHRFGLAIPQSPPALSPKPATPPQWSPACEAKPSPSAAAAPK